MATYDPVSTATALAESYVYARQSQVDTGTAKAQGQTQALTTLKSSLTSFTTALSTLSNKGSVVAQTAKVSVESKLVATASSEAAAGTYNFTVKQLAQAQQSVFDVSELGLTAVAGEADTFTFPVQSQVAVSVGSSGFYAVNLADADSNNDGKLSVTEIARAVNAASDGKVTAAVITRDGKQQLLLNSTETGQAGAFSISKAAPVAAADSFVFTAATGTDLSQAQDAKFVLGSGAGLEIVQSSNTYTGIAGVSIEFKAQSTEPVTVTVARDESATKSNMQNFVDAYNTLVKSIDKLTSAGDSQAGVAAGALSGDSSIRGMRNQLNSLLRTSIDGVSLTAFGISAQRDGTIALDSDRFEKKLAENPQALESLLGQSNALEYKRTGVIGKLQSYVEGWTKTTGGHLQSRQESLQKQIDQFDRQQSAIDRMYEQAYQRYLLQFTALSSLEEQMGSTSSMLSSLFASSSSS